MRAVTSTIISQYQTFNWLLRFLRCAPPVNRRHVSGKRTSYEHIRNPPPPLLNNAKSRLAYVRGLYWQNDTKQETQSSLLFLLCVKSNVLESPNDGGDDVDRLRDGEGLWASFLRSAYWYSYFVSQGFRFLCLRCQRSQTALCYRYFFLIASSFLSFSLI